MNDADKAFLAPAVQPVCLALCCCLAAFAGCTPFQTYEPPIQETAASSVSGAGGRLTPDENVAREATRLVNEERALFGLPSLTRSRDLDAVAYRHALDLISMDKLSHISSDGRRLENRLAHLRWIWAGENLARNKGFENPAAEAVRGWKESPRHRDNMFRPDFTHCGMASIMDPSGGFVYIVQIFLCV